MKDLENIVITLGLFRKVVFHSFMKLPNNDLVWGPYRNENAIEVKNQGSKSRMSLLIIYLILFYSVINWHNFHISC